MAWVITYFFFLLVFWFAYAIYKLNFDFSVFLIIILLFVFELSGFFMVFLQVEMLLVDVQGCVVVLAFDVRLGF